MWDFAPVLPSLPPSPVVAHFLDERIKNLGQEIWIKANVAEAGGGNEPAVWRCRAILLVDFPRDFVDDLDIQTRNAR